jgi:hypothetical protein
MRYIRAGGCGVFGLSCLFALFAVTSAIILLGNWWLGRWSNSERIRYSLNNTTNNCSSNQGSNIPMMSSNEWLQERDKYFYVFLGKSFKSLDKEIEKLGVFFSRIKFIKCSFIIYTYNDVFCFMPSNSSITA